MFVFRIFGKQTKKSIDRCLINVHTKYRNYIDSCSKQTLKTICHLNRFCIIPNKKFKILFNNYKTFQLKKKNILLQWSLTGFRHIISNTTKQFKWYANVFKKKIFFKYFEKELEITYV